MPSTPVSQQRPSTRALLALLLLAAATLVGLGPFAARTPASAHDQVTSTSPTDGAQVGTTIPEKVTITLSDTPNAVGTEVRVMLDAGQGKQLVSTGDAKISGTTVTQSLDPAKTGDGTYTAAYRITSSDGHTIGGSFTFTAGAGAAAGATGGAAQGASAPDESLNSMPPMIPIILGIMSIILLAALAAVVYIRRHPPTRMD